MPVHPTVCTLLQSDHRRHFCCTPTAFYDLQNNPLYLETMQQTGSEGSLRFHYIVHCSLDAVEEKREWASLHAWGCLACIVCTCCMCGTLHAKGRVPACMVAPVAQPRKLPGEPSDAYLGLLYPTEDFKVYGWACFMQLSYGRSSCSPVSMQQQLLQPSLGAALPAQVCQQHANKVYSGHG